MSTGISDVKGLGWIRILTTDLEKWRELTMDCLGFAPGTGPNDKALYCRMDERPHRLAIIPGDVDKVEAVGWEVRDSAALARVKQVVEGAGISVEDVTHDELEALRVVGAIKFIDPAGTPVEIFYGPALDHRPVLTKFGHKYVTGDQGMGHFVVPTQNHQETVEFYENVLGFVQRGSMSMGPMGRIQFLSCNERHHTLAIVPGLHSDPPGVVHLMVETDSLDAVGMALDRVERRKFLVSSTLGRHTNDKMVSFYVRSPGGFDIEYGFDGLRIDESYYTCEEITADSYWGHAWTDDPPAWLVPADQRDQS